MSILVLVVVGAALGVGAAGTASPGVGAAGGFRNSGVGRREDGQIERIDLRAVVSILVLVVVGAALGVGVAGTASPGVGAAGGFRNGGVHWREDGQIERIDLRAVMSILVLVVVGAALGVGNAGTASPGVGTASGFRNGRVYRVVNRQVQRIHLRATVGILMLVEVGVAFGVSLAVGLPSVGAAASNRSRYVHRGVHGQHHRHEAVATVGSFQLSGLCAGLIEGLAVPHDGQLAGAYGLGHRYLIHIAHRQDHRHHRVTTVDGVQGSVLRGGTAEDDAVPSVRQRAGADSPLLAHRVCRVDGQREHHHTVAAVSGLHRVGVFAARGEGLAVEVVSLAIADGGLNGVAIGRVHIQGHHHQTVATVDGLKLGYFRAFLVEGDTVPLVGQLRRTDGLHGLYCVHRVDGQREDHHTVATVDGLQRINVITTLVEELSGENVGLAFAAGGLDGVVVGRVHRQDHLHKGVAAVGGGQGDKRHAGLREGVAVPGVRQLVRTD